MTATSRSSQAEETLPKKKKAPTKKATKSGTADARGAPRRRSRRPKRRARSSLLRRLSPLPQSSNNNSTRLPPRALSFWTMAVTRSNTDGATTHDDDPNSSLPSSANGCHRMSNLTARLPQQWTVLVGDQVTDQLQNPNAVIQPTRSTERGIICNLGNQVQVWKRILDVLGVRLTPPPGGSGAATAAAFGWKPPPTTTQQKQQAAATTVDSRPHVRGADRPGAALPARRAGSGRGGVVGGFRFSAGGILRVGGRGGGRCHRSTHFL